MTNRAAIHEQMIKFIFPTLSRLLSPRVHTKIGTSTTSIILSAPARDALIATTVRSYESVPHHPESLQNGVLISFLNVWVTPLVLLFLIYHYLNSVPVTVCDKDPLLCAFVVRKEWYEKYKQRQIRPLKLRKLNRAFVFLRTRFADTANPQRTWLAIENFDWVFETTGFE